MMKTILHFASTACLAAIASIVACGCSGGDTPDLGKVTGKVTLDGKPVAGANIQFYPTEGGRASSAVSDDSGQYELTYKGDLKGAKVGPHVVSVTTAMSPEGEPGDENYKPGQEETIPEKYQGDSELKVDVKAGDNEIPLELKS